MKDSIRKFQLDRSVLSIFRSGAIRAGGHAARSRSIQNATSTRTLTLWRRTPRPILRRADAPRLLSTHTMASACAGMVSVASLSARQVNGVRARQPVRPPTTHPGPREEHREKRAPRSAVPVDVASRRAGTSQETTAAERQATWCSRLRDARSIATHLSYGSALADAPRRPLALSSRACVPSPATSSKAI